MELAMGLQLSAQQIESRVAPHVPEGERFAAAVQATVGHDPFHFGFRYRVVVVTDARIHLFTARIWRACDPSRLVASFPAGTRIERRRDRLVREEIWIGGHALSVTHAWRSELDMAIAAADRH